MATSVRETQETRATSSPLSSRLERWSPQIAYGLSGVLALTLAAMTFAWIDAAGFASVVLGTLLLVGAASGLAVVLSRRRDLAGPVLTASAVAGFTAIFGALAISRHRAFLTHAFDMGQMIQALYSIRHGGHFSTVVGLPFLGDHARFVLYPLAFLGLPAQALLVGQAAVLALGAVPLFLLTRRHAPAWAAVSVVALYVAYPSLQWTALFDLHPEVAATTLLLWAFWAAERRRPVLYGCFVFVALLCREDVAVAVALLGFLLVVERRRLWGGLTIVAGAGWFVFASAVQRAANPWGLSVFQQRYGWLFTSPGEVWSGLGSYAIVPNAVMMAVAFLLPALPMFWARWSRLVVALPMLALNLLSTLPMQRSAYFHYGFLPTVFIFVAVADGMTSIAVAPRPRRRAALAVTAAGALFAGLVVSPFTDLGYHGSTVFPRPASIGRQLALTFPPQFRQDAREMLAQVGDGSVAASANLLPQLAERTEIYMLPNPFFPAWYGEYLTKDAGPEVQPVMPDDPPTWVVVDRLHGGPDPQVKREALIALLPTRYTLVDETDNVQLWKLKEN